MVTLDSVSTLMSNPVPDFAVSFANGVRALYSVQHQVMEVTEGCWTAGGYSLHARHRISLLDDDATQAAPVHLLPTIAMVHSLLSQCQQISRKTVGVKVNLPVVVRRSIHILGPPRQPTQQRLAPSPPPPPPPSPPPPLPLAPPQRYQQQRDSSISPVPRRDVPRKEATP